MTDYNDGVHPLQAMLNKSVKAPDYELGTAGYWRDQLALGNITNDECIERIAEIKGKS